jgi:GTP cyclohydrolase IA
MQDSKKLYEIADLKMDSKIDNKVINESVREILLAVGENPDREGLKYTPDRVSRMYSELLEGYRVDPIEFINDAFYEVKYNEPVLIRDIEFYSLCEHHMLPIMGRAHVAYIPNGKILGLSKIPRIVDMYARRLQIQERMTQQIAEFIEELLKPQGVAVVIEALHLCSMMRGVGKHDARMTTSNMRGLFQTDSQKRNEFLDNISRSAEPLHF